MTSASKVAFIGLGQMGLPMASHLLRGGFAVTGFDLSEKATSAFGGVDGQIASSVAGALAGVDVIITMLPNGKAVQSAILSNEHICKRQRARCCWK